MERDLSRVSLTSFSHGDPSLASYNWDEVFVPAPPTSLLPSLTTFWARHDRLFGIFLPPLERTTGSAGRLLPAPPCRDVLAASTKSF